jgi:hypothetical protein
MNSNTDIITTSMNTIHITTTTTMPIIRISTWEEEDADEDAVRDVEEPSEEADEEREEEEEII